MLHAEGIDRAAEIHSNFFLFGVEAHALADYCRFGACGAPDREGHLEADGQLALAYVAGAGAKGVPFAGRLVEGEDTFLVGGDVASHVYVEDGQLGGCKGGFSQVNEREKDLLKPCMMAVLLSRKGIRLSCSCKIRCMQ